MAPTPSSSPPSDRPRPLSLLQLARENGVNYTSVIKNGQMLGVADRRNKNTVSIGSAAGIPGASMLLLGEAQVSGRAGGPWVGGVWVERVGF